MTITEASRFQMYTRLIETLGQEEASTMMEHLPPVGWANVVFTEDVRQSDLLSSTRHQHSVDYLSLRIDQLAVELRSEIAHLGIELRSEMAQLAAELRLEISTAILKQTKWIITTMIAFNSITIAACIAVVKLL